MLLAVKILNGEARIVGTYPEDDYGVEMLEKPEGKFNLMERIERVAQEVEDLKKERRELSDKLACVPSGTIRFREGFCQPGTACTFWSSIWQGRRKMQS